MSKEKECNKWIEGKEIKQLLLNYVDVGQLPPEKAEAFIERLSEGWLSVKQQLERQGVAILIIPVRTNTETRFETVDIVHEQRC